MLVVDVRVGSGRGGRTGDAQVGLGGAVHGSQRSGGRVVGSQSSRGGDAVVDNGTGGGGVAACRGTAGDDVQWSLEEAVLSAAAVRPCGTLQRAGGQRAPGSRRARGGADSTFAMAANTGALGCGSGSGGGSGRWGGTRDAGVERSRAASARALAGGHPTCLHADM